MEIKTKGLDLLDGNTYRFIPPAPTETEFGGIKAKTKTTESLEVAVDPTTGKAYAQAPAIDKTLTKEGEAADAKAVGDKLTKVENDTATVKDSLNGLGNETVQLKEDLTKLDVLDLALVRKELGTELTKVNDIVLETTGGKWEYKFINVSDSLTGIVTVIVDDLYLPSTGELRIYSISNSELIFTTSKKGTYVVDLKNARGLRLQLQASKDVACEAGTYYAKEIRVFTGDITKKVQGLPDYFTGTDVIKANLSKLESAFDITKNLYNRKSIILNKYIRNTDGIMADNPDYFVTSKILVAPGEKIWINEKEVVRFIAAFDKDGAVLPDCGYDANVESLQLPFQIQQNVSYIRLTFFMTKVDSKIMINKGDKLYPYDEFEKKYIPQRSLDGVTQSILKSCVKASLSGGTSIKKEISSLVSNTELQIPEFPYNLKKGIGMTFYSKFTNFTSVEIGKGRNKYRGDSLKITSTNVEWIRYDEKKYSIIKTIPHGLTISKFVSAHLYIGNDTKCHYAIETFNGLFEGVFDNWTEMNGIAFAIGGQDMTEVELRAIALDIKCPIWLFGDSYFGVTENRIIGQLKNLGFYNNVLISGLAGMTSQGAYADNLIKLINIGGIPKYIVWCEGMNGASSMHIQCLDKLINLCKQYSIELILYKLPTVPSRIAANNENNIKMLATGCRYIDAYKAVGADDAGNWYAGYLDTDGVHPTVAGAKAIAHRIIIDFPEIMQYGYAKGNVSGNIVGDV